MKKGLLGTLFGLALATLGTSITAPAYAFVLDTNTDSGYIRFSVDTVGADIPAAKFDDFNPTYPRKLLSPGGGFPVLGASTPLIPERFDLPIDFPNILGLQQNPAGDFGGANTSLFAIGFPDLGLIAWQNFSVSDFNDDGKASVNVSTGLADFIQPPGPAIGFAFLSVLGNVGVPNGYVAASLAGTVGGIIFQPIIIASDGVGSRTDFISAGSWTSPQSIDGQANFRAAGLSLFNAPIPPNGRTRIDATLTLIASNGSLVGAELPPGAPVPPFGLGPNGGTVIPTPAMLPGLISMGIAAWRKRRQEEMAGEQGADPVLEEV